MFTEEKIARLRLLHTPKIGRVTFFNFLKKFGSAKKTIEMLPEYLKNLGKPMQYSIVSEYEIQNYLKECQKSGVSLIFFDDKLFPKNFLSCFDYSPVLYCKGNLELLNKNILAIVGSRIASLSGIAFTKKIVRDLKDIVIISGLAKGIDTVAHETSLKQGTIAVLGSGVNHIYPEENKELYNKILASNGLIISEIGLNEEPKQYFFSYRNRMISGISNGVLVVEAGMDSDSLITAKYALDQGKNVYSVPGHPYDPKSIGTNYLIKNGAILTRNAEDIIEEFWDYSKNEPELDIFGEVISENNIEEVKSFLLTILSKTPTTIYDIKNNSKYSISDINAALVELEILDLIVIDRQYVFLL